MSEKAFKEAAALIAGAEFAIALTGAGFSTPSGIPDFRSHDSGLWEKHDPMSVASITSFKHRPQLFYEWMRPLVATMFEAQPNAAHYALARLEHMGRLKSIITQNIDMLHGRAGSKTVYEVHGHLREATCLQCFRVYEAEGLIRGYLEAPEPLPLYCENCGGVLKPNVILFGEQLPIQQLEAAERDTRLCDVLIVAGSSLEVYPVADLPRRARASGAKIIIINYTETAYDRMADVVIRGDVADVLPQIVEAVEMIVR